MAERKSVRIEVNVPFDKLTEFMDYMDRLSVHVETIDMDSTTPKPLQECSAVESVGSAVHPIKKAIKRLGEALLMPIPQKKKPLPLTTEQLDSLSKFEQCLHYTFNDKNVLLEALTHGNSSKTLNYQRLEVIGDAALGFLSALHFFKKSLHHTAGDISGLRSACVCNDTFGVLAAKYGFHLYVQNLPPILVKQLDDFLAVVERENFTFAPFERELAANDNIIATQVAIPSFLADVFEAVAGAIIVDSNVSLETLENVYAPFMNLVYDSPPVSPFLQLENTPGISIRKGNALPDGRPTFCVYRDGVLLATGTDEHKKHAKLAASKYALWKIEMGLD